MSIDRMTQEYGDGCKEFIRFAVEHAENPRKSLLGMLLFK